MPVQTIGVQVISALFIQLDYAVLGSKLGYEWPGKWWVQCCINLVLKWQVFIWPKVTKWSTQQT